MEEQFSAVKFKTVFTGNAPPVDDRISELQHWCRIFHDRGLARPHKRGSYGNLSFRDSEGSFIITGSGVRFGEEWVENPFVRVLSCDLDNQTVRAEGTRDPSSESLLHFAIYKARPEINAVFHGHSRRILERAAGLGLVQTLSEEPYGSVSLARSIVEVLDKEFFIVIRAHGFVSLGLNMKQAGELACSIQDRARAEGNE
ncbi:MAG: class II aldolase/adducin family protein [Syntrophaceae bacterium]|jgi:L-fuculose-phosphate aldolase